LLLVSVLLGNAMQRMEEIGNTLRQLPARCAVFASGIEAEWRGDGEK
jgi:hypothetical protein